MNDFIKIRGAREHNLKNIDLDLPKGQLIVFTGLSGSGKSSLAFDTIYAEGQRRYVESLSSYARQFLGVMDKPDVDHIEGLSPSISIDQKSASHNPRSTVGTVTEIYDYLRLLFARIGHPHCPVCGREIARLSPQQIVDMIFKKFENSLKIDKLKIGKFLILSPVIRDRKGEFTDLFSSLRQKGFTQVRVDGKIIGLDEDILLLKNNKHTIDVVVDRLMISREMLKANTSPEVRSRLFEAVESALKLSEGLCILSQVQDKSFDMPVKPKELSDHLFSERFSCPLDNISLPEIEPRLFSFNSPHGACPTCTGLGTLLKIDDKSVLNPNLTISEGGILPYANTFTYDSWFSQKVAQFVPIRVPIRDLTPAQKKLLLYGSNVGNSFEGIIPNLERRYKQTQSDFIRREIEKYMRKETCPECTGRRLKPEALSVTIEDRSIVDITRMSGVLYVLDEPSIGLHQRDNQRLINTLKRLRDLGNTVIVVEHDRDMMLQSDFLVDFGPGAGDHGGLVVSLGTPDQVKSDPDSLTGNYISGKKQISVGVGNVSDTGNELILHGASEHNLKNITVAFPLGKFIVIAGVSGSGKSTLLIDILYQALAVRLNRDHREHPGKFSGIEGVEDVNRVIMVDQSPIGRTPRSNPATYTGLFTPIRDL